MKKLNELQSYLTRLRGLMLTLIILCSIGSGNVWGAVNNGDLFERISAAPSSGDEVLIVNAGETYALSTTQNTNNRGRASISTSSNQYIYASTDNVQVLTVKVDGTYFGFHTGSGFLKQPSNNNYLHTTSENYSASLADNTKWSLEVSSSVFTITSKRNTSYMLQYNSSNGIFASYKSSSKQADPSMYKKVMSAPTAVAAGSITSSGATITITDATNVNNYEVYCSTSSTAPTAGSSGTTSTSKSVNLTGLNANTTYYVWARAYSTSPARKTGWVALTGTTFKTAAASKTLSSIAITSQPTKRAYLVGQTFSSTGAVVTATYSDASTSSVSATWTPTTGLVSGSNTITASYTEGGVTRTATTTVTGYTVTVQVKDVDGNTLSGAGAPTASATGASITASESGNNYVFKRWVAVTAAGTSFADASNRSTTLSGTPTGAVTIKAEYYKPITITYKANSSTFTTQTYGYGGTLAFPVSNPDGATYSCTGKTFVGWVGEANKDYSDASTPPTYATAGGSVTAAATYYAVFATAGAGGAGEKIKITPTNSELPAAGSYSASATSFTIGDYTFKHNSWCKSANPPSSYNIQAKKSIEASVYNVDAFENKIDHIIVYQTGTARAVTITGSYYYDDDEAEAEGETYSEEAITPPSTAATMSFSFSGKNHRYFYMSTPGNAVYMDSIVIYTRNSISYTDYVTKCCTPLGSVTGNIGTNTPTSVTLTWSAVSGAEKYQVKVPGSSSHNDWTDAVSGVSVTKSCGTAYTAYFRAIDTNGSHCSEGPESTLAIPAVSWTVTSTGITHATASPAIPSTTCSGFSTTISAATGYALPAEITVTNASKTWNSSTGALTISSVTGNVSITITPTCVPPVITADPDDASYYVGDSPDALEVTATLASGTRTYLWKVSTNGGSTWSDAAGTNNAATYSGASLSTASVGTLKFKCIVGNSEGGCTVESGVATITVSNASYFPNGKTIFIQAESTSAWTGGGCVKAWFHTAGGSETAQSTYWLFDATGGDAGKKLFATVVPATGDLPYLDIQRFAANCSDWWNKNGGCSYSDANGSNTIRSTGKHDDSSDGDYIRWNVSGVTIDLHGDPSDDDWASSLASFSDDGAGVWTATYNNYAPADAGGESQDFKAKTNYNGWIGNTGNNDNATLDGMHVGSTYNITATLDVTDHSLVMSKEFVKGTVHFDLQGHGLAISDLENVAAGSKISAPSAPSATGYTFGGWFKEPACTNAWTFASDVVNETMTLYAKWTANVYTITKTFTNVANAGLPASFTYTGSTTTALNSTFTVDATNFFLPSSIAVTMGGTPLTAGSDYTYNNSTGAFTFSAVITGNIVITATATAKLKSIAITTQPTTRKYFAGESFSSTGAVVTATMGDGSTKAVSATWTPSGALSAGTGQTVTATYTEAGIEKTATTTVDVYSVTVNKKNEDGDAIDVVGVTATWTVGTKALAAGVGSTKYAFKQWEVTGASIGSTTSASTTLSSPTANVIVNAIFYKPRVVKWSVNGNDSYNTGSPTTTVAYNGTISTVPTNPSGLACASTFVAWTDAAHNNGTTAKASASYYGAALYTAAGDFPAITDATTTFYAVFAEGTGAAVNTVMWSEDWTGYADNAAPSSPNTGDGYGAVVYGGASIGYAWAAGTGSSSGSSKVTTGNGGNLAGGTSPEAMIGKTGTGSSPKGGKLTISGILPGGADSLTLTYKQNAQSMTVSIDGTGYYLWNGSSNVGSISHNAKNTYTHPIVCGSASTFSLTFQANGNNNVRLDDIEVKVRTVSLTNYVTECDGNIVKVTYNANGGTTSCTNTTTDKTEDFTVCSSAPTRDYYTFAGWLCSADDKVYAASATIDDAVIDADFSLTAQWTPVNYSISYNLNGGTNAADPIEEYNVETVSALPTPTKGQDRFDGWFTDNGVWSNQVASITAGMHGDLTLYAKWTSRNTIIFEVDGSPTTIYRANDENLEDAVAGQGSKPDEPDAPSACSSKVFVGWSESTIDDETDTRPGDLTNATGTVNSDKHYYAVWALQSGTPIAAVEDNSFTTSGIETYCGMTNGMKDAGDYILKNSIWTSSNMSDVQVKIKVYHLSNKTADVLRISLVNSSGVEVVGTDLSTTAFGTSSSSAAYSSYVTLTPTSSVTGYKVALKTKNSNGACVDKVTREVVATYSAYSTSCCATKVTLSQNSPSNGTIAFGKTTVPTCGEDKNVSLTITPAAGYQLHSYEVATGGGKVATKSVSPAIALDNNSSAAQNITLTFAKDANGAYDVTASFTKMAPTAWEWTYNSAAIPNPINLYVGQTATLNATYTPSGLLNSEQDYDVTKSANLMQTSKTYATPDIHYTFRADAAMDDGTVTLTNKINSSLTTTVHVHVDPLPRVHFVDLVHGKEFADVVATIAENALNPNKTTKTSVDWVTPNANTCEENHLHLVGWIREDWPALVNYLNGTGDAPTTTAIVGAGNDASGHAYFFAPGAAINVLTFNGKTFYAVWAEIK